MATENTPNVDSIAVGETIRLHTRFGGLSRGRSWGKVYPNQTSQKGEWEWVDKGLGGVLLLTKPGYYIVGSADGFKRKASTSFVLHPMATQVDWDALDED